MTLRELNNEFPITKDDILDLYNLACAVGTTFQHIRIGEDNNHTTECRLALEKPYIPLAKKIEELYARVRQID